MKILEVINSLSSGGAERFVVDLCNQMVKDGHEVTLLTLKDPDIKGLSFYKEELSDGVIFKTLKYNKFNWTLFFSLYKTIKNEDCEIVHLHLDPRFFGCLSFIFDRKKRYFVTSHNQAEKDKVTPLRYIVLKLLYKLHTYNYIAISHQNSNSILDVYGRKPLDIIYNGRAEMGLSSSINDVRDEIEKYKSSSSTSVFTIIARCSPQKNIPRLIRCFNEVINKGYDVTLLVIGDGYDNEIGKQAKAIANSRIHFLGAKHNVSDYLSLSDFFILSSDHEGMPITLIEAMANGCIPVGTPVSGFNDVIIDGENGFISKDFSDESFTEAIIKAISNKETISSQKLKETYKKNFSMESCARHYEDVFSNK